MFGQFKDVLVFPNIVNRLKFKWFTRESGGNNFFVSTRDQTEKVLILL